VARVRLNGKRIPGAWSNKLHTNIAMGLTALLFGVLGVQQLVSTLAPLLLGD
jgi:hypothetical protein